MCHASSTKCDVARKVRAMGEEDEMRCKHKTKQSRRRENQAVWNTLGGTDSIGMEWSALLIGLFVSCSCCGLQGLRNVPAKPLVEEKDILYTVQTLHINHYTYICVTRECGPT